jgi:hypothetical protein
MNGDGSDGRSFATTIVVAPRVHLLPPRKKNKEKMTSKKGQRGKFCNWGHPEKRTKRKKRVKKGLVGSPIVVPLGGLVVNLLSKFGGHNEAYQSNHFLEERRRIVMTTALTSIGNKTTKVKRLRQGGVFFFFLGFVLWWVPFFYIFVKPKKKFITKNLVITYKLNIIEGFYHKYIFPQF